MQRALSAEHLAELARGTFQGLRRFIPRRQEGSTNDSDPLSLACKTLEEKAGKGHRIELSEISALFESFAQLVKEHQSSGNQLSDKPSEEGDSTTNGGGTNNSGSKPSANTGSGGVDSASLDNDAKMGAATKKLPQGGKSFEMTIGYFVETLQLLYRSQGVHLVRGMVEAHVLPLVLRLLKDPLPLKVVDCLLGAVRYFFVVSSTLFSSSAEVLVQVLGECDEPAFQLRLLLLLHQLFRQTDLSGNPNSFEMKSRLEEYGIIPLLLAQAEKMKELTMTTTANSSSVKGENSSDLRERMTPSPGGLTSEAPTLGVGVLSLALLSALFRDHPPHKEALLNSNFVSLWVFYASNATHLQCTHTTQVTLQSGVAEDQTIVFESPVFWAGELAEMITELCAEGGSLSLRRQELQMTSSGNAPAAAGASTAAAVLPSPASSNDSGVLQHQWVPLPANWDSVLHSGSMFLWRLASAVSSCHLTAKSAVSVLDALGKMDVSTATTDTIYCNVVATFLLLCRSSPRNSAVLSECGAFKRAISLMSPRSRIFNLEENKDVLISLNEQTKGWSMTTAFLTTLCVTHFAEEELRIIMNAVDTMIEADYDDTSAPDCLVIEHCNTVLAGATFSPYCFWFDGTSSKVSAQLEKFCGRWYGYSFVCWLCTSCVWPEGGLLYAFSEPTSNVNFAIFVIANGRSKCLAIRSSSGKGDVTIAMIPEAALSDDWNHVAVIHNISGLFVHVNGRKCSTNTNVSYPKEPPKPHRLSFYVGGADQTFNIPPLFGMLTSVCLMEGVLAEKDIERLVAAGPGSAISSFDPPLVPQEKRLVSLQRSEPVELGGTLVKPEHTQIRTVTYHPIPSLVQAMKNCDVIGWATTVMKRLDYHSDNSVCVIILCMQLVAAYLKQNPEARQVWHESEGFARFADVLLSWPEVSPEVLGTAFMLLTSRTSRRFFPHPNTYACLQLLLDTLCRPGCPVETKVETLKELGSLLMVEDNSKIFKETPKSLLSLLECSRELEGECVGDFVVVIEKIIRDQAEMELVLRYLIYEPETPRTTVVKCELGRMLYDVAKPQPSVIDILVAAGGVNAMMMLCHGSIHHSEALRVYALRLLSLILHCSRKSKDAFLKSNGFEMLAHNLLRHAIAAPIGLPTYNCIFKMALDFFQPNNSVDEMLLLGGPQHQQDHHRGRHVDPNAQGGKAGSAASTPSASGHLPGIVPKNQGPVLRSVSYGSVTGSSECSDLEARLSLDDAYNSQSNRDTLVNPLCVYVGLELLAQCFRSISSVGSPQVLGEDNPEVDGVGSDVPSSETSETSIRISYLVLNYLDRVVDLSYNAVAMLSYPWLEWLWIPYASFLATEQKYERLTRNRIDAMFRSVIRKLAVADLARLPKASNVKKIKEMCDVPQLQCCVIEEIVRHFSSNNRLDQMTDAREAENSLKNLDNLLANIDEGIQPLPHALVQEIVSAINDIAVNSNNWVRAKMKNGKLFDTRDRVAFMSFTTVKNFAQESPELVNAMVHSVHNEPNSALHVAKLLTDAVKETSVEKTEILQGILRTLFGEEEPRRALMRALGDGDRDILERLLGVNSGSGPAPSAVASGGARASTPNSGGNPPPPEPSSPPSGGRSGSVGSTSPSPPSSAVNRSSTLSNSSVSSSAGNVRTGSGGPQGGVNSVTGLLNPNAQIVDPVELVTWAQANEERWHSAVNRILRVYRQVEADINAKADRREKEGSVRLRARKADIERKQNLSSRIAHDCEKAAAEYQTKAGAFFDVVLEVRSAREKRFQEMLAKAGRNPPPPSAGAQQ